MHAYTHLRFLLMERPATIASTGTYHQHGAFDPDFRKKMMFADDQHPRSKAWDQAICVNIFASGHHHDINIITMAQLDHDMYSCGIHPLQQTRTILQRLHKRKGVLKHVQDIVSHKLLLCVPDGPNPVKIGNGKAWSKKYSALQYVTRQDFNLKHNQYNFNSNIKRLLEAYIKTTFFNKTYISGVLKLRTQTSQSTGATPGTVTASTSASNVQLHMRDSTPQNVSSLPST